MGTLSWYPRSLNVLRAHRIHQAEETRRHDRRRRQQVTMKFHIPAESTRISTEERGTNETLSTQSISPMDSGFAQWPTIGDMVQHALHHLTADSDLGTTLVAIKKHIVAEFAVRLTEERRTAINECVREMLNVGEMVNITGRGLNGHIRLRGEQQQVVAKSSARGDQQAMKSSSRPAANREVAKSSSRPTANREVVKTSDEESSEEADIGTKANPTIHQDTHVSTYMATYVETTRITREQHFHADTMHLTPTQKMVLEVLRQANFRRGTSLFALKKDIATLYGIVVSQQRHRLITAYLRELFADGHMANVSGKGLTGRFRLESEEMRGPGRKSTAKGKQPSEPHKKKPMVSEPRQKKKPQKPTVGSEAHEAAKKKPKEKKAFTMEDEPATDTEADDMEEATEPEDAVEEPSEHDESSEDDDIVIAKKTNPRQAKMNTKGKKPSKASVPRKGAKKKPTAHEDTVEEQEEKSSEHEHSVEKQKQEDSSEENQYVVEKTTNPLEYFVRAPRRPLRASIENINANELTATPRSSLNRKRRSSAQPLEFTHMDSTSGDDDDDDHNENNKTDTEAKRRRIEDRLDQRKGVGASKRLLYTRLTPLNF